MTVELIRHGNTLWQGTGRYQGKSDVPLSAAGLAELHPPEIGPETVYITRLCRTRQTAERLFPHATLVETDGLEEMDFGDFEGRSANDMARPIVPGSIRCVRGLAPMARAKPSLSGG